MSHTPGPWVIDYEGTVGHIKAFVGDKTPTVCKYGTDYRGERHSALEIEHQDEVNARLIAAAPELLEAAEEVLANWSSGDLVAAVRELDAAVKKAKGGAT